MGKMAPYQILTAPSKVSPLQQPSHWELRHKKFPQNDTDNSIHEKGLISFTYLYRILYLKVEKVADLEISFGRKISSISLLINA